jgi:hypothetical protein
MGSELLENERADEGDDFDQPPDDQDVCGYGRESETASGEAGESQSSAIGEGRGIGNLAAVLATTIDHFFPDFNVWLRKIPDPRDQGLITYQLEAVFWQALLMLITRQGSRLKISNHMRGANLLKNLRRFSGQVSLQASPHGDTVEHLFRRLDIRTVEQFRADLVSQLIRARVFECDRLIVRNAKGGRDKYYRIAIDGVHLHSFDYEHCPGCLVKKDSTTVNKTWMHYKLQASLVTANGFCIPVACEWIENEAVYVKQDCELKAAYRLIRKIRGLFPRLEICILLDALYAAQPFFQALKDLGMEYVVVFKEGVMPEVWGWQSYMKKYSGVQKSLVEKETRRIPARRRRTHPERLSRPKSRHETREVIKTVSYEWNEQFRHWDQERIFNILSCNEEEDGETNCQYTWIISDRLNLCEDNVKSLATAGRLRWVIENQGNNVQKNGGYALEHQYSRDEHSMKVWNLLLDIAHMISQLIEKGSLIIREVYGTLRDLAQRLFEHLRYYVFEKPLTRPRIQIRFNSS